MDRSFFIVARRSWVISAGYHPKRLLLGAFPLGPQIGHLSGDACNLQIKVRQAGDRPEASRIVVCPGVRIEPWKDEHYVRCEPLCTRLSQESTADLIALFFEGTPDSARCVVDFWTSAFLERIVASSPELRLDIYGVPPDDVTLVEAPGIVSALYREASALDPELYAVHATRFLDAPHIITALYSHLLALRTEDNIRFPIQVKRLAEQLRSLLQANSSPPQLLRIEKSHRKVWAEAKGMRFGFLDGGVARVPSLPGINPAAMRVGVYSVRPGICDMADREAWMMRPYVIGDMIDRKRTTDERGDPRRLLEAARYTLEPLTGLEHLGVLSDTRILFMHGPLVNQFTEYNEGRPHYIPFIEPGFLERVGLTRELVTAEVKNIPDHSGASMWNHFMAVYTCVMRRVAQASTPIVGVVERAMGRKVTLAVVNALCEQGAIPEFYRREVIGIIEEYDITDDFLFGCILREGEYVTPVTINKNPPHKAAGTGDERWKPVVKQIPEVACLVMKSDEANFPFRVEMNTAAAKDSDFVARIMFHTARLLPRYAFPVGLDIADKYAKVPDWIARGVSASLSAAVLKRAIQTGDPRVVAQIRLLLARGPRDFFYRPSARSI